MVKNTSAASGVDDCPLRPGVRDATVVTQGLGVGALFLSRQKQDSREC